MDILLLIVVVIIGSVVAIEGLPDGFNKKAKAFVTQLAAAALSMFKALASIIRIAAGRIGHRARQLRSSPERKVEPAYSRPKLRVVLGTAAAVISSPFGAIPTTLVFALSLYALGFIGGDEYSFVTNASGTLRYIVGYAFVILVATIDIASRWSVVALPSLIVLGFIAASRASRSNRYFRSLALSTLLIACAYPLLFLLAAALDVFNEPIFN